MKFRSILAAAVLATAAFAPAAAFAQASTPAASQADPERLDLARQMVATMHIKKMLPEIMKVMFANMPSGSEKFDRLKASMMVGMETTEPDFEAAMVEGYAQLFTAGEMRAAVAFYTSPEGQSVLAKSAQGAQLGASAMRSIAPQLIAATQADYCSHAKCDAEDAEIFKGLRMGMGVTPAQ